MHDLCKLGNKNEFDNFNKVFYFYFYNIYEQFTILSKIDFL